MIVPQDDIFRREAREKRLRFTCEDCVHWDPDLDCAHGYPSRFHRAARYEDPASDLRFCKDFDLA